MRLWCFPYAGGSAAAYRSWDRALPGGVELCPIEFPGHGTRFSERGVTRVEALAAAVADGIQPELDLPYVFFGHSLGAVIAFEVVRELRRRGQREPRHLVVSARPTPRALIPQPHTYDLPDGTFAEAVCCRYGMVLPKFEDPSLLRVMLAIMRADIEMHETYRYRSELPLECALAAWAGADDPLASPKEMEGWCAETSGPFSTLTFPGQHFYLRTEEPRVLAALAEKLEEALAHQR